MTDNSIVDIKTGKPVKPSESHGGERATLIQDGKRWQMLKRLHEEGGFTMETLIGEFTFEEIVGRLDIDIQNEEKAQKEDRKRKEYLKRKALKDSPSQ